MNDRRHGLIHAGIKVLVLVVISLLSTSLTILRVMALDDGTLPTRMSAPSETALDNCMDVLGDSLPAGAAAFQIPGVDWFVSYMRPIALFIKDAFVKNGYPQIALNNYSIPASGLIRPDRVVYLHSRYFWTALHDQCKFVVIFPWYNDMNTGLNPEKIAVVQARAVSSMVQELVKANPDRKVLVLEYYDVYQHKDYTVFSGSTARNIDLFNAAMTKACTQGEMHFSNVHCIDVTPAFAGMGQKYVAGATSRATFNADLLEPLSADTQKKMDYFFRINPNGQILGDGVHFSAAGKTALASFLVRTMIQQKMLGSP